MIRNILKKLGLFLKEEYVKENLAINDSKSDKIESYSGYTPKTPYISPRERQLLEIKENPLKFRKLMLSDKINIIELVKKQKNEGLISYKVFYDEIENYINKLPNQTIENWLIDIYLPKKHWTGGIIKYHTLFIKVCVMSFKSKMKKSNIRNENPDGNIKDFLRDIVKDKDAWLEENSFENLEGYVNNILSVPFIFGYKGKDNSIYWDAYQAFSPSQKHLIKWVEYKQ